MIKKLFDLILALIGLIIFSPIFVLVFVLIVNDSGRPVLYRGKRTGLYGEPFNIYKFRTMVIDAEKLGGMSTAKNDPRITRLGKFLRRYKLDELPQLINVLKGQMSIVGPRPEMPEYTNQYTGEEKLILTVRPGITDYASLEFIQLGDVLGDEDVDKMYEERIRPVKNALRVKYVKEQSFLTDILIILRTLVKLVGSYA